MTQSTFSAQVANNLLTLLQGYSKNIRFLLVMFLTLTISAEVWAEEATLSFADKAQRTSFSTTQQVWEQNGVTFTNDKASSSSNVADYAKPVRLYASSQIIVAHSSGKIKSIVFDCNSGSYATAMKNSIGTISGVTVTASSDKVTVEFTNAVASFTVAKLSAQVRLDALTVIYENAVTTYSIINEIYSVTADVNNAQNVTQNDTELMLSYSAKSGWNLPATISVTMGGTPLSSEADYDWDSNEGSLYITLANGFTGDIVVTINGWQQLATPNNLQVTDVTSTAATLSWSAVTHAQSYTIQVLGENDVVIDSYEGITKTTYTVTDLDICDEYLFGVIAVGDGVTYYNSAQETFDVFATPLGTPNVIVSNVTATSFTLSWDAVDGATSYNVYNYTTEEAEVVNVLTYTFNGLDPETEYEWEVEAVIIQGDTQKCSSEQSNWTTTLSGDCEQLGKATNLEVDACYTNPEDGQTYVRFSWIPATSSKENTSQKICFGFVGQDATCKEREYNITWAGDLASKLPAGEYEWSIQAIGDGVDYCDGDAISGPNFTIYSITYNTNGGAEIAATSGTTLPNSLPTTTREHYTFVGWYTDTECTQAATAGAKITQNTTLYAKWEAETFQITLNPNEGTLKDKSGNVQSTIVFDYEYDSQSSPLSNYYSTITRDGYEFVGWFTEQSGGEQWTETGSATQNITLYAQWVKLYTVTLAVGPGNVTPTTITETSAGAGVELPTPTLDCGDWEFAGWAEASVEETTTEPTLFKAGDNYKPISDCELYAVYQRTEETEGGGGTENVSRSYTFSNFTAGTQYAENEVHKLDNDVTLTTTDCHFTSELRIYSSSTYNGYVVSNKLPGRIVSIGFNAGNKVDDIDVFGSTNGTDWTKVGQVSVTSTSYKDYTLSFDETDYTYFKLDVAGANQVRLKSITITWESSSAGGTITTTYYNSNPVCQTCENILTISKGTETNGTFTLSKIDEIKTCDGVVDVLVTPTPAEHYHIGSVTATTPATGGAPTMTDNGDGTWTVTYAQNSTGVSTINVDFVEDAKATIILSELGETTIDNSTYYVGEQCTLPTNSLQSCEGKVLVGWSTVEVVETDTKPTENYYELGATVTLEAEQTFYAVFAKETIDGGGVNFTIDANGDFMIGAKVDGVMHYASGEIGKDSNGKITGIEEDINATIFTFTSKGNGEYSIYDNSQSKYLAYGSSTDLKYMDDEYIWTITGGVNGTWRISSGTTGRALIYRASTYNYFGGYSTSNCTVGSIYYYDIEITAGTSSTTYTAYSTSCGTYTVTFYGFNRGGCTTTCGENPAEIEVAQGATYTIPNCVPNDPAGLGRTFAGTWNTQADGQGSQYEPGDGFTVDSDITLYAQWILKTTEDIVLPTDVEDLATTDIVVTGGTTLTLEEGTTTINSLTLEGGRTDDDYLMPAIYSDGEASVELNNKTIPFDLSVDKAHYYPFAVPFPVAVSDVDYADPTLASASVYGTHYVIKRYDGAMRAENGENKDANWVKVAENETLQPGIGYIITAVPINGEALIRFPMNPEQLWLSEDKTVDVEAHTGTAAQQHSRHAGWNFIANPYLSRFAGVNVGNDENNLLNGVLNYVNGEWQTTGEVPYVTIPAPDFTYYEQVELDNAILSPSYAFFVQAAHTAALSFATTGRQQNMPALRAASKGPLRLPLTISQSTQSDRTTLLVSDDYTTAYEIGKDLEKMFGSAEYLTLYSLMANQTPLAFCATPWSSAVQSIPLGYRTNKSGSVTIALDASADMSDAEMVLLYDAVTGMTTNLLLTDYVFETETGTFDARFTITITPKQGATTDCEEVMLPTDGTYKFIENGQLYINHKGVVYTVEGRENSRVR